MSTSMSSPDLVARLRERAGQNDEYDWHGDIEREAAAEIERLREALGKICFLYCDDASADAMAEVAERALRE